MIEPIYEAMQPSRLYRAYLLGSRGHIDRFEVIEADSDAEAVAQARQLVDGHAVELWDRGRMIGRFEPNNLE